MNGSSSVIRNYSVAVFFGIVFAYSWFIWIGGYALPGTEIGVDAVSQLWSVPAAWGLLIAPVLVLRATNGNVQAWAAQAGKWRVKPQWYVAALGLPVLLNAASAVILVPIGVTIRFAPPQIGEYIFNFLLVLLLAGGLEEFGWRGFALPRLQGTYGALGASLIIGIVWSTWHLPLYVLGDVQSYIPLVLFSLQTIPEAIFLTWLYNNTGGSVLLCMLFHTVSNITTLFIVGATLQLAGGGGVNLTQITGPVVWWFAALVVLGVYGRRHLARTSKFDPAVIKS
jgi:membrane protease YdiL (CAAX protease family)